MAGACEGKRGMLNPDERDLKVARVEVFEGDGDEVVLTQEVVVGKDIPASQAWKESFRLAEEKGTMIRLDDDGEQQRRDDSPAHGARPIKVEASSGDGPSRDAAPEPGPVQPVELKNLSSEQERVLKLIQDGKNVFFTGSAGTGKSFLMNAAVDVLRKQHGKNNVGVTAATGLAATHIGGTTVHSFCGCGVPHTVKDFQKMYSSNNKRRLRNVKALVIDECSMISAEMFEYLERTFRAMKNSSKPFAGVQLVFCGDFFQLPPIPDRIKSFGNGPEKKNKDGTRMIPFLNRGFMFQAPAWKRCEIEEIILTKVFRQEDQEFVRMLNDIRIGKGHLALQELLRRCSRPVIDLPSGIKPTILYSRNTDVDRTNREELDKCRMPEHPYESADWVEPSHQIEQQSYIRTAEQILWRAEFFRDCLATKAIQIRLGAQVMLLKNIDLESHKQLVNGSRGVIKKFVPRLEILKKYENELDAATRLRAGAQIEKLTTKVSALRKMTEPNLPVVLFTNGREEIITPEKFSVEFFGIGSCCRVQLPLKLAWALTIHKCQGLTLDFAQISLRSIFADGQTYVALSRIRSLAGLQILNSDPKCLKTNETAKRYYRALESGTEFVDNFWQLTIGESPEQQNQGMPRAEPTSSSTGNDRAREMPPSKAESAQAKNACFICRQPGHWARDCPQKNTNRQGSSVTLPLQNVQRNGWIPRGQNYDTPSASRIPPAKPKQKAKTPKEGQHNLHSFFKRG